MLYMKNYTGTVWPRTGATCIHESLSVRWRGKNRRELDYSYDQMVGQQCLCLFFCPHFWKHHYRRSCGIIHSYMYILKRAEYSLNYQPNKQSHKSNLNNKLQLKGSQQGLMLLDCNADCTQMYGLQAGSQLT